MSRVVAGCVQCEQPSLREEGIWPALMISSALSEARSLVLFAQECTQPSPNELIEPNEGERMGMLEVAKPAAQRPIKVDDDAFEAIAARAPRLLPDLVFEVCQAGLADKTASSFKA